MTTKETRLTTWFAVAGSLVAGLAFVDYLRDVFFGDTRPNRTSWGIWSLIALLGLFSAEAGGAGQGTMVVATFFALITITFLVSLTKKYGDTERKKYEPILGLVAVVTLVAWKAFSLPDALAVTVAVLADLCALWPTLSKAWSRGDEPVRPWLLGTVGFGLGILAIGDRNYVSMAYPVYLAVTNALIVGAAFRGKHQPTTLAATKGPSS